MSIKAMQEYTFVSKYARYLPDKKRRETWEEAVERVRDMHIRRYPEIKDEIHWAFEQVKKKRVLGSQRALQFGGPAIEKKHARMANCSASYCDRVRFFQEAIWLLLCGVGVGFSVQKHHIAKLPPISQDRKNESKIHIIDDSIEGWADSFGVLISSYLGGGDFPEYEGYDVEFDFSPIREEGSDLSSSNGKAPGPKPLKIALEHVDHLFKNLIKDGIKRLRPIHAYDIVMHGSDAVLAGGHRRSACLCLFSPDDEEMLHAKTGDWFHKNPQRGRSNNSALLVRDKTRLRTFLEIAEFTKEFGEPGFIWSDSDEVVYNPCVEVSLYPVDVETGKSGWQLCNLSEINGKYCTSIEKWELAVRAATIIGTCQAGYTDFEYLGETTEKIVEREALLGVSITGMMDNPDLLFDPQEQRKMARLVLSINKDIAGKIGINPTARACVVKPSGTASSVLATASGIHPHHYRRYIRRFQANHMEAPMLYFKEINPAAVERSVWSQTGTDEILSFCIEVEPGAKTKNEIGALQLLKYVKLTQINWVNTGTVKERCTKPFLRHNVSNTITVKENEWDDVISYIYQNRRWFAGISLLPITGDKDYPQAPFTAIYTPSELVRMYGDASVMASGLVVDGLHAFSDNLWRACEAALGLIETTNDKENEWVKRAKQFAERYFKGNVKKMTYCLKDVNNWHLWCTLKYLYKHVDYTNLQEDFDDTKPEQVVACAGGACELTYA